MVLDKSAVHALVGWWWAWVQSVGAVAPQPHRGLRVLHREPGEVGEDVAFVGGEQLDVTIHDEARDDADLAAGQCPVDPSRGGAGPAAQFAGQADHLERVAWMNAALIGQPGLGRCVAGDVPPLIGVELAHRGVHPSLIPIVALQRRGQRRSLSVGLRGIEFTHQHRK